SETRWSARLSDPRSWWSFRRSSVMATRGTWSWASTQTTPWCSWWTFSVLSRCPRQKRPSERMRRVIVLGSTGSIGVQALEVIAANRDRFEVVGLSAGRNREKLAEQAAAFGVSETALGAAESEQLVTAVAADVVVNGITGSIGLGPTL